MTTKTTDTLRGWGWPLNSKKAHYFNGARSLCMKWMYGGKLETGNDDSVDNCAECRRRLLKQGATAPTTETR